jgi:hypothetical protein
MKEFDMSVIMGPALSGQVPTESRIRELFAMGFNRVSFLFYPEEPAKQWAVIEQYGKLIKAFR